MPVLCSFCFNTCWHIPFLFRLYLTRNMSLSRHKHCSRGDSDSVLRCLWGGSKESYWWKSCSHLGAGLLYPHNRRKQAMVESGPWREVQSQDCYRLEQTRLLPRKDQRSRDPRWRLTRRQRQCQSHVGQQNIDPVFILSFQNEFLHFENETACQPDNPITIINFSLWQ